MSCGLKSQLRPRKWSICFFGLLTSATRMSMMSTHQCVRHFSIRVSCSKLCVDPQVVSLVQRRPNKFVLLWRPRCSVTLTSAKIVQMHAYFIQSLSSICGRTWPTTLLLEQTPGEFMLMRTKIWLVRSRKSSSTAMDPQQQVEVCFVIWFGFRCAGGFCYMECATSPYNKALHG